MKKASFARYMLIGGVVCILLASFFGIRIYNHVHRLPPPGFEETNVDLIQSWMTIRYVSKIYNVPEEDLTRLLEVNPEKSRVSLGKLAEEKNLYSQDFLNRVRELVKQLQEPHPSSS